MSNQRFDKMLDFLARCLRTCKAFDLVLAIDSTYFDTHHHSRHYEYRCRHHATKDPKTANLRRAAAVKKIPKLALAVDASTHMVLAARTHVGMGADYEDFTPLPRQACGRVKTVETVVADSGYDSHTNHTAAREEMGVHSLIKADSGRPTQKAATSAYRREMKRELAGSQKGRTYGKRVHTETVNSMIKRNLGDSLRAKSEQARSLEQLLRVLTHDLMILWCAWRVETEPDATPFKRCGRISSDIDERKKRKRPRRRGGAFVGRLGWAAEAV